MICRSVTLTSIRGSTTRDISRLPTKQSVTPDAEAATVELLSIISPERIKSSSTRFKVAYIQERLIKYWPWPPCNKYSMLHLSVGTEYINSLP